MSFKSFKAKSFTKKKFTTAISDTNIKVFKVSKLQLRLHQLHLSTRNVIKPRWQPQFKTQSELGRVRHEKQQNPRRKNEKRKLRSSIGMARSKLDKIGDRINIFKTTSSQLSHNVKVSIHDQLETHHSHVKTFKLSKRTKLRTFPQHPKRKLLVKIKTSGDINFLGPEGQ